MLKHSIRQKLPVTYLLLTFKGRIDRTTYWYASIFMWSNFYVFFRCLDFLFGYSGTWIIYPLMLWGLLAVSAKRFHDIGKSGFWFWIVLIPIFGPVWLFFQLGLRPGNKDQNPYGLVPGSEIDYHKNNNGDKIPHLKTSEVIINDITQLNPILVDNVYKPNSIDELIEKIKNTTGPISIGGGRFSMGGQTASNRSLHIDMRGLNKVLEFSEKEKRIRVETGIRWCDIQDYIDPNNLSVKIMQTYANFTVGGSLSVNVHGRYIGLGPLVLSVSSIKIILGDGSIMSASRTENKEIFFASIGGYNALGIIIEAELELAENILVKRISKTLPKSSYLQYFTYSIRDDKKAIFHNGDIYPPEYKNMRAVTWEYTLDKPTVKERLMPLRDSYPIHRYFMWEFTETPLGKWRRQYIMDPILFFRKCVHWRNYEAGYDVAELEPISRKRTTYVLQEYFVPVKHFNDYMDKVTEILKRHKVNMLNISVRHAIPDTETYMSWAREEVFAFVMYYKQRVGDKDKNSVAVWTRELISAAIEFGGAYYLPYQVHATDKQFHLAFPKAKKTFELKGKLDPNFRFRNIIWDTYYDTKVKQELKVKSDFHFVFSRTELRDAFYKFLQVIFHLYPEDLFHTLIIEACEKHEKDEDIYNYLLNNLDRVKPFLSEVTYGLPALFKQKKELLEQTLKLLGTKKEFNGYLEIGSTGRYISVFRKKLKFTGPIYLINEKMPTNSPADIFERGQIPKIGTSFELDNYIPISQENIANNSLDLVTCYIGLHHSPLDRLSDFIKSIHRVLRTGGIFILRDHDVQTEEMSTFVSLVHTVFNAGLMDNWEIEMKDFKKFRSIEDWIEILSELGFTHSGEKLLQKNDPTDNTLLLFTKR